MLEMAEHYDPDLPLHENEIYVAKVRERATKWETELGDKIRKILK